MASKLTTVKRQITQQMIKNARTQNNTENRKQVHVIQY